jgi:hypothetical protein
MVAMMSKLAGRGGGGGLVEGLQHGTEGRKGNDEGEVVKETFVDTIRGAGGVSEEVVGRESKCPEDPRESGG